MGVCVDGDQGAGVAKGVKELGHDENLRGNIQNHLSISSAAQENAVVRSQGRRDVRGRHSIPAWKE